MHCYHDLISQFGIWLLTTPPVYALSVDKETFFISCYHDNRILMRLGQ